MYNPDSNTTKPYQYDPVSRKLIKGTGGRMCHPNLWKNPPKFYGNAKRPRQEI
jgi:hypothetical protein